MSKWQFNYPSTRQENIVDDYHGTLVADPYRWLEDPHNSEVQAWTAQQNILTTTFLDAPEKNKLEQRLTQLWNYPKYSVPERQGDKVYFWRNQGLQAQPVMYFQVDGKEPVVFLDPNQLSDKGIISVMTTFFDEQGQSMAYSLSESGSDWQIIKIRDTQTGEDYPETLEFTRFSSVAWRKDGQGFFYTRYPQAEDPDAPETTLHHQVYWHQLGTPQAQDTFVYSDPEGRDLNLWVEISEDGRYLILILHEGTDRRNRIYYQDLEDEVQVIRLLDQADAHYQYIGSQGSRFFFLTDADAPRYRLIALDIDQPEPEHWKTLIAESEDVLAGVHLFGGYFVAAYLHHAHHRLKIHNLAGDFLQEITLPTLGSITEFSGKPSQGHFYFGFTSFLFPTRIYRFDFEGQSLRLVHDAEIDFDAITYETHQFFATSQDGTEVPFFMVCKKGTLPDQSHPTVLYGYGGFRIAMSPGFNPGWLPWLDQGGILCVANLRGGSEYGTEWYQAGTLERKQNVFDDFVAVAEYLITEKYTVPEKLAIRGGSNGGLLVAACMLQRPELFGAVLCHVPVLDMLRYHKFTIGRYWISDYGNAEADPEQFGFMYAYSPLHNVKTGKSYPPILIMTADHDDRVVPAHAKKFAATLQAQNPENLALLLIETDAGHGRGKPTHKTIEEWVEIYTFLNKVLN